MTALGRVSAPQPRLRLETPISLLGLAAALALVACADDGAPSRDAGSPWLDGGPPSTGDAMCSAPSEQAVEVTSALHVPGEVAYADVPPAGGNHNGCWGKWGVHERELADERFVHNLEHGGIVFLYRCPEGCDEAVSTLREVVRTRDLALLTPYAALPTRFAVVAWGYRLISDCLDRAAFERFYDAHRDMGLESVPDDPPSSCL